MHLANFFGIRHADTDAQTIAQARAQGNRRRARRGLCYTWHRHVDDVDGVSMAYRVCRCRIDATRFDVRHPTYDIVTVALTHA